MGTMSMGMPDSKTMRADSGSILMEKKKIANQKKNINNKRGY